jgi:hypothetical protein
MSLYFTDGGREYEWGGGFGNILSSYENGVEQGQCRVIVNRIFYAFMIERKVLDRRTLKTSSRISWSVPGRPTAELLREIKAEIFN